MKNRQVNTRAIAVDILALVVFDFKHLDQALDEKSLETLGKRDQAFVQELCYGVMRWYPRLQWLVNSLLDKALKRKDQQLSVLMMLGIYQLEFMRTPEHAAVSATVDACNSLGKPWAKNLVNAVLRRFQREKEKLENEMKNVPAALYAHPGWFIKRLKQDWPGHWQSLLETNNQKAPMHLRVNLLQAQRDVYLEKLRSMEIGSSALPLSAAGIKLDSPKEITGLPGFADGSISVQDQGAQLAAGLLDARPHDRVLDACAAPGGKSAHILEAQPQIDTLIAIDRNSQRTRLLGETRDRLKLSFEILEAESQQVGKWWDGKLFDRILLDAPCSASGIVRRHPDIKFLRSPKQLEDLHELQSSLLQNLWAVLKPGGKMLYCTCSIFHDENDMQIEGHTQNNPDARVIPMSANWGAETRFGRQALPVLEDTDGFYYALLEKVDTG